MERLSKRILGFVISETWGPWWSTTPASGLETNTRIRHLRDSTASCEHGGGTVLETNTRIVISETRVRSGGVLDGHLLETNTRIRHLRDCQTHVVAFGLVPRNEYSDSSSPRL